MNLASFRRWTAPAASLLLFCLALVALHHFLKDHSLADIVEQATLLPWSTALLGLAATALSYFVLTGYDVLALRYVRRDVSYPHTARASFCGYAFSHNLGLTLLSSGSARYRFYRPRGLDAVEVAQVVVYCNLFFWVGFFAVGGIVLSVNPLRLPPDTWLPFSDSRPVGLVALCILLLCTAVVFLHRGSVRIRGRRLSLPSPRIFLLQLVVASADWLAAALVLFVLLPDELGLPFGQLLTLFLLAQVIGMASSVPGGLGVFESVLLFLLPEQADLAAVMGRVLVYRVIYYLLPLLAALLLLALPVRDGRNGAPPDAGIESPT